MSEPLSAPLPSFLPSMFKASFAAILLSTLPFQTQSQAQSAAPSVPATSAASAAAPARDPRIAGLLSRLDQTHEINETALSPDGNSIAWVEDGEHIKLAPLADPAKPRSITAHAGAEHAGTDHANGGGPCHERNLAWAPDSTHLAFTSDCAASGQAEIYLAQASGGAPQRLTHLHGLADSLSFSPDGKQIGFLYVEGATRHAGALDAMKPWSGVIGVEGVEIQRVAAVDLAAGQTRQLTPANLHVYEYDWSPDSRQLAYVAAAPPGENNWWVAQLYTQPVSDTGEAQPHSILDPAQTAGPLHGLQIAVPRWSPDGRQIAFIGGLMSDQGATGGDIYLLPASGGEPKDITSNRQGSPAWFLWLDQDSLGVAEVAGGSAHLFQYDVTTQRESPDYSVTIPATVGDGRLEMSISVAKNNQLALIRSSFNAPPEVWAGPLNQLHQITHVNDAVKPAWGKAESMEWKSAANASPAAASGTSYNVQGWLLYPANYDPAKKYPLIVYVHGGPSSAVLPRWPGAGFGPAPFSALDYFVLMPNPRGSYGQGETFTQANVKDFGYGDLRDILAGVDAVEKKLPIDDHRVGLTGWSYGGFMTMFAVTQTHRFQAAVAGAGISDWQSYYGENSIDQWMVPFFGASVYDDPAVYAKSSAIDFIKQVKTPTLVVVGDRDGECPAPQSFEFWHALRAEHVPTQLVIYPNEGHHFVSAEHRRDVLERALAWFNQYMPAS